MAWHNQLGKEGEDIAAKYLEEKGFCILERNWRFEKKEIDIIACLGTLVVIAEVKTRKTDFFGEPEEAVTRAKQKLLISAADMYVQDLDFEAEVRYDIISIVKKVGKVRINHIEDAFIPTL